CRPERNQRRREGPAAYESHARARGAHPVRHRDRARGRHRSRTPRGHPTGRSLRRRMIRRSMTEQNPKSSDDTPAEAGLGEATPAEASQPENRLDFISIFPAYLAGQQLSLIRKDVDRGQLSLNVHDLRDFTFDRHNTVDDSPYGGGAAMVMKAEPWALALEHILTDRAG